MPLAFSDGSIDRDTVAIAAGVIIENAIGGSGDDRLMGNDAANILRGGGGADELSGGGGSDTLVGGYTSGRCF